MAVTTSLCMNLSSPRSSKPPPSLPSKQTQSLPCDNKRIWRRQCVKTIAWVIIGLQISDIEEVGAKNINNDVVVQKVDPQKWSEKRICPPWQLNSLETIVPENLPRPTARRRIQTARYSSDTTAPPLVAAHTGRTHSNCFSM